MSDSTLSGENTPQHEAGATGLGLDLTRLASGFIAKHGAAKAAEVAGVQANLVARWESGQAQPKAEDLQKLLEFDPDPLSKVKPLYPENPPLGGRLAILMLSNRAIQGATMESVLKLYDSSKMQFIRHSTNNPHLGRNVLAQKFLQSGCEWALWVDDDMILPCGDADWFKRMTENPTMPDAFAGLNTIGRLIYHKKTLVGGCYFNRSDKGKGQFNEAASNPNIDAQIKQQGPRAELLETRWVATGCMLVRRQVFVDIANKFPEIRLPDDKARYLGYIYSFFSEFEMGMGEDVSFCLRAEKAGHKAYVDLAVMPAHIGLRAYNYQNTK